VVGEADAFSGWVQAHRNLGMMIYAYPDVQTARERSQAMPDLLLLSYFYGGLDHKLLGVEHLEPIKEFIS